MTSKGKGKSSDRRAVKRKDRNKRGGTRIPELGYYLIVIDTEETEKNYFEGLRDSIPAELKDHLVIKVEIVFDRDQVKDFELKLQTVQKVIPNILPETCRISGFFSEIRDNLTIGITAIFLCRWF